MPLDGLGRMARGAARVLVLVLVVLVLVLLVLLVLLAPLLLIRWLVMASGATHVAWAAARCEHNEVKK